MTAPRLAIIGDGKMGRAIETLATEQGWSITAILGERESMGGKGITAQALGSPDVAVEFTEPRSAASNIEASVRAGVPVVVGTTGWYAELARISAVVNEQSGAMLWAPNFSLGVNILLELARKAGELVNNGGGFDAHITEIHHAKKKDAPSGTALALADAAKRGLGSDVPITSIRTGSVPGTHELLLDGTFEQLSLTHVARDRRVFAEGALHAAKWLVGKQGVFTMRDVLGL